MFEERFSPMLKSGYEAQLNLAENENGYEVTVDLPGVEPDEVDIRIDRNTLTISGERVSEKETDPDSEFHRVERVSGKFCRTVILPGPVDEEQATAEFKSGVLKVSIPKAENAKPRRIKVR